MKNIEIMEDIKAIQDENFIVQPLKESEQCTERALKEQLHWEEGRLQLPQSSVVKAPGLMIVVGILFAIPTLIFLVDNFTINNLINSSFMIFISISFILSGSIKLIRKAKVQQEE